MSPEYRNSQRINTDLSLNFRYGDKETVTAKLGNISLGGAFVEGRFPGIKPFTLIDVWVTTNLLRIKTEAIVAHCHPTGIGMMFTRPQPELYQALPYQQPRHAEPPAFMKKARS